MSRYDRNRIYVSTDEQKVLRNYKLFLAGCGIGSVIAECALRMGFENIVLADGDIVEITNINRQNYSSSDIGRKKVDALKSRLLNINPEANISIYANFLKIETDIDNLIKDCHVAINALDFQSKTPFLFDKCCRKKNIPVIHPYNIGWATLIYIIEPDGPDLSIVSSDNNAFEIRIVRYLLEKSSDPSNGWIDKFLDDYENEKEKMSAPQLSIASWLAAGLCVDLLYRLATNRKVKGFPEYYLTSVRSD